MTVSILSLFRTWCYAVLVIALSFSAWAGEKKDKDFGVKIALQSKLAQFLVHASAEDGGFVVLDRKTAKLRTLYATALHPQIIPVGDGFYLCVDMRDKTGQMVDADFLLRAKSGIDNPMTADDFILVDVIIDNRALLRRHLASQQ